MAGASVRMGSEALNISLSLKMRGVLMLWTVKPVMPIALYVLGMVITERVLSRYIAFFSCSAFLI